MKTAIYLLASFCLCFNAAAQEQVLSFQKSTTPETKHLLSTLTEGADKGIMFGHQDDPLYGIGWEFKTGDSDVRRVCGDFPAVMGFDLGEIELGKSENLDEVPFELIREEVIAQYHRGGISTISWHVANPLTGGSSWDVSDTTVVTSVLPGGSCHEKFTGWMDLLADFILSLETADGIKVPVLFRPWHEHTGSWFWWGQNLCSKEQYKSLWVMVSEYLHARGVQNVLYAYSPGIEPLNTDQYLERYPGSEIIDLLGFDYYQSKHGDYTGQMQRLLTIMTSIGKKYGKPIAITETGFGTIPDSNWWTKTLLPLMEKYPISYVLVWRNTDKQENHYFTPYPGQASEEDFVKFYQHPKTLFAKDIKSLFQSK